MSERQIWQKQLSQSQRSPKSLIDALKLPSESLAGAELGDALFPLKTPEYFLNRIQPGNPQDPLLRQILPTEAETLEVEGYSKDPLQERLYNKQPGILHKYQGRALLMPSPVCAINCRYCFRRHFPYAENTLSREALQEALNRIKADSSLAEIILSGGDPLTLKDAQLAWIIEELSAITHLTTLRIHSRIPTVMPERITPELIQILGNYPHHKVLILHCNHPDELSTETAEVIQKLKAVGFTVLNQSVLLKGVNDDASLLAKLSKRLFEQGALPYYLHALDAVEGTAHFEVPETQAKKIMHELASQLPGYLVPRFVREVPGRAYKSPLI